MIDSELINKIEETIGCRIISFKNISGGDISTAIKVDTDSSSFFVKYNSSHHGLSMFDVEAKGLNLLRKAETFKIPKVIAVEPDFLILEYFQAGVATDLYWEQAGISLAKLHETRSSYFGLGHDNYIGSLNQLNNQYQLWSTFYSECRLTPQFNMAVNDGFFSSSDRINFEYLILKLPEILPEEAPSLIHGDLWSGNIFTDKKENPILIDPAVCFAHREMDIAMSLLFGGFSQRFYDTYQNAFPLLNDWQERIQLYQLYYLLVHVNLFGRSYVSSCIEIIKKYT